MTTQRAPLIVFGYNRPDHLARTLERVAEVKGAAATPVWLFCDGPRPGWPTEPNAKVRAVARDPRWVRSFASVEVRVAETNKGLANSIIEGIGEVMSVHGRAIVLEDDILVSSDFLEFMNECLNFYREDARIGSVTGFCPLTEIPRGYPYDVMAVPRNSSQGWGTWADRWEEIAWDDKFARQVWSDKNLRRRMNEAGADRLHRLHRQFEGAIDSWSIRFGAWQTVTGRLTIYPVQNRIVNFGYDGTGIHSGVGQPKNDTIPKTLAPARLSHVEEAPRILAAFRRVYSGPRHRRVLRAMRMWARSWKSR